MPARRSRGQHRVARAYLPERYGPAQGPRTGAHCVAVVPGVNDPLSPLVLPDNTADVVGPDDDDPDPGTSRVGPLPRPLRRPGQAAVGLAEHLHHVVPTPG